MARQTGISSMLVSWTAASPPPIMGYRVTAEPGGISQVAPSSPLTIGHLQPGVYRVQVVSLSQHLPSEAMGPVEVTVKGERVANHIIRPSKLNDKFLVTSLMPELATLLDVEIIRG